MDRKAKGQRVGSKAGRQSFQHFFNPDFAVEVILSCQPIFARQEAPPNLPIHATHKGHFVVRKSEANRGKTVGDGKIGFECANKDYASKTCSLGSGSEGIELKCESGETS